MDESAIAYLFEILNGVRLSIDRQNALKAIEIDFNHDLNEKTKNFVLGCIDLGVGE